MARALALPAALCASVLALCYGALLVPGQALVARDLPYLHLPLRTTFRALLLAAGHLPSWDPLQHAGQPILSNPHYAAFYPATWLLLFLPPIAAIHGTLVLHAMLAFAGAWRLAGRFGAGRLGRATAAIAYSGSGILLSLPGFLLMFCGMAWLPWALALAEDCDGAGAGTRPGATGGGAATGAAGTARRALFGLATVLGLQVLNGDPAAVVVTVLMLTLRALLPDRAPAVPPWRSRAGRLGLAVALGLLLGAVQALPTWARLRDSSRAAGLADTVSATWSTHPARLAEIVWPRLFGDAARDEEVLYFGTRFNDREFPFLQSIYPGLAVVLLGLSAFLAPRRESIPRRRWLTACALLGVALALGRFEPLYPVLRVALPFLSTLRYPEKFLLLALPALVFAAALELDRLWRAGRPAPRRLLILGALAATVPLAATVWAIAGRAALEHAIPWAALERLPADLVATGARYLSFQWALAAALATAWTLLLAQLAPSPARRRTLAAAFVALLIADLAYYGHGSLPTAPAATLLAPRPLERAIAAGAQASDRIFTEELFREAALGFRFPGAKESQIDARLDILEPTSAATLGFAYALHRDFDLMLTSWGRLALAQTFSVRERPDALRQLLELWNVGTVLRLRSPQELLAEYQRTGARPQPVVAEALADREPRWRCVQAARFVPLPAVGSAAVEARLAAGAAMEELVGSPEADWAAPDGAAQVESVVEQGDRIHIGVRAHGDALLVGAITFDDGWTAHDASGTALRTWPTALGQIAVRVPAGTAAVDLRYRDPWVSVGAALSLATALALALAYARATREPA